MDRNKTPSILLASASPRRVELLSLTGWRARTSSTDIDESARAGEDGEAMARRLAEAKARWALDAANGTAVVIAADTVVTDGTLILGKPANDEEAQRMLTELRGHSHRVVTAVALLSPETGELVVDACETRVPMRSYTDEDIRAYVALGGPRDKAGGYGIQDDAFRPVAMSDFRGCYANVMGLPLCHLVRSMRRLGNEPAVDVPASCQRHNNYTCDVYSRVLGDAV